MDPINIKVVELKKSPYKELQSSELMIEMEGKTMSSSVANTLRRISMNNIPTYGFCKESIFIEENTSIYDNDYMRLRLSQFVIPNISNNIDYLQEKYWQDVDYADPEREKHPQDKLVFEVFINTTNTTKDTYNVTTNDAKYFKNASEVKNVYDEKYPHLIIQLKPTQTFKCRMVTVMGIGKRNAIWSACHAYYEEKTLNDYKISIRSFGQLSEYEILLKACNIIKIKLLETKKYISEMDELKDQKIVILRLQNEDHSLGYLLGSFLQENKKISYAGFSKPDLLIDEVVLKIESVNDNPIKTLFETMDYLVDLFDNISRQLKKLAE